MPGFHTRYTGMPGLNSYSMPGSATCDTGHKALCPVSSSPQSSAFTPRLDWRGPCALPGAVYGLRLRPLPAEHAPWQ